MGDGWLMTLELSVDSIDENQKDKTLTEFAETLRNSKLPDKAFADRYLGSLGRLRLHALRV